MKKTIFLLFVVFAFGTVHSQTLFSNAFGDPKNPALLFIHDGPGNNPVSFEIGSANSLADAGYYVITFDQRGCGRSKKDSLVDHYKFNKANEDINTILKKYKVDSAVFVGHGWGGVAAVKYAEYYPEKVKGIILTNTPMNYQLMYKTILERSESKYKEKKDTAALRQLKAIRRSDTTKLDYNAACMGLASKNGLYEPSRSTEEREAVYDEMKKNKKYEWVGRTTGDPVYGFFMNEQFTTLDLRYYIKKIIDKKIPVYGIYGKDDGLFNDRHLEMVKKTVGETNLILLEEASHWIFIDQRKAFVDQVKKFLTPPVAAKKGKK